MDNFLDVLDEQPPDISDEAWAEFEINLKRTFAAMQREDEAFIMGLSLRDALLFTADTKGSA